MASGITPTDDIVTVYNDLKLGRKLTGIQTENNNPIYICTTTDGPASNKIIFIVWLPDTAKVKSKMIYAASKDALKKKLIGIGSEIQATDPSELEDSVIGEKLQCNFTTNINFGDYFPKDDCRYAVLDPKQMIIYRIKDEKIVVDQIITSL